MGVAEHQQHLSRLISTVTVKQGPSSLSFRVGTILVFCGVVGKKARHRLAVPAKAHFQAICTTEPVICSL